MNALGEVLSDITERSRVEELQAIDLSCQKLQHLTNVPCSDKFLLTKKAPFNLGDNLCSIGSLFLGRYSITEVYSLCKNFYFHAALKFRISYHFRNSYHFLGWLNLYID